MILKTGSRRGEREPGLEKNRGRITGVTKKKGQLILEVGCRKVRQVQEMGERSRV